MRLIRPRQLAFAFDAPSSVPLRPAQTLAAEPAPASPAPETLPALHDAAFRQQRLARDLTALAAMPVELSIHDNRSTMVSFRRDARQLTLRIHHMFLDAGPEVARALVEYARLRSRRAGVVLDEYVRSHRTAIKPPDRTRQRPLETAGRVHDLAAMYARLNARYFSGAIDATIGWGRGSTGKRRRSIRMGAYFHETRTILIHPALDRPDVPAYFVELVVYHEMLHQAVPQQRDGDGRRCIHTPEFRRREAQFDAFEPARAWERRHLALLLKPTKSPPGRG